MSINKPDWDKFKAKFSENPQSNFEWLCYMLFCKEFNKHFIFRYKNQFGIETDPVIVEDEVIGWQAKFYGTTLSSHKTELIETIKKIKKNYPNLTKVIFYTNQEWGQGHNQNDPNQKIEVEKKAEEFKIKIEWRTASFFETPFVTIDNRIITQHFFRLDKSIIDLLKEKEVHTESLLYEIQTNIDFKGQKIEIDRSGEIKNLQKEIKDRQILIISGIGGVGKTALIKNFYEKSEDIPFYIFKANEFNINVISDLFNGFKLSEFLEVHKDEKIKIVVIDSAEKLLELQKTDIFKEFLLTLIKNKWKIIFTTRNNYLEDLTYDFIEIHKIIPVNIGIQILSNQELENLSKKYNFLLPKDFKLLELIKNPFYLNEYLKFYSKNRIIDYYHFKEKLWNRIIKKSNPAREQYFLEIAFQRANLSQFFVKSDLDHRILNELVQDGILGYETPGYFITHDIYEEWALEKIIESEFINKLNNKEFFNNIGESLPIRRGFRNWVSEKLLSQWDSIKQFIEEIIQDDEIKPFWKDEILVSVLLSDYSEVFFELFKDKLLENDQIFIKKLTFLLRTACKEVDNDFFRRLGINDVNLISNYIFTKPKGKGWQNLIKFVNNNLETFKINNVDFILPVIYDWNTKFKEGETTKISSLIALKFYQRIIRENKVFTLDNNVKEKLFQTILFGSSEIKDELIIIFDEVLQNKFKNYRDPYYDLIKVVLTKLGDNLEVIKILPEYVLKLAELFWLSTIQKEDIYSLEIEDKFCLETDHFDYFPSSSFQTPIYWLLKFSLQKTVDFILSFTNKTVGCFAKSDLGKEEVQIIDVFIENGNTTKQYIGDRVWNIYRGTQVSPNVLQSMHMALERFFLEIAKDMDPNILELWLLYILKGTKSASITAIIISIVLAFPEKTFNVAKVLFQTKEFFIYDTHRMSFDPTAKGIYSIGSGYNPQQDIHRNERIETCNDKHRNNSLEQLALNYQVFRNEEITEEEGKQRQNVIWDIYDKYYQELSEISEENDFDKTWRLYLARMDRRKMTPKVEEKDGEIFLNLNPKIDSELQEFSDSSISTGMELMKHSALNLWGKYKVQNDERYKQYEQYNNNPKLVFEELKEVIDGFKRNNYDFFLFNRSIPGDVSAVLIRDYFEKLSKDEKILCKDIILEIASSSLKENYAYQLGEGVESAFSVLHILFKEYPDEKEVIKYILLLTLFDPNSMGANCEFCDYSKRAIVNDLWDISFEDAQSLLLGYLWLKPKYEELRSELRKKNHKKNIYINHEIQLIKLFNEKYETEIKKVIDNKIPDIKEIEKLDLYILKTAFQLIPLKTDKEEHKHLAYIIILTFSKELLSNKREDKVDYRIRHAFLEKLAYFVLNSSEHDITHYLNPFINKFNNSEVLGDLFNAFIYAEDSLNTYNNFWKVWNLFYEKIVELCDDGDNWYTKKIIKSYLFAEILWKNDARKWGTFKESDKHFFKKITENIGQLPSVLFSISKLLNGVGSIYQNDGIFWFSKMLKVNENLWSDNLDKNTIYYLENLVKKYSYTNRERLRKTNQLKQEILVILDFLIEKESVVGYLLREYIL